MLRRSHENNRLYLLSHAHPLLAGNLVVEHIAQVKLVCAYFCLYLAGGAYVHFEAYVWAAAAEFRENPDKAGV